MKEDCTVAKAVTSSPDALISRSPTTSGFRRAVDRERLPVPLLAELDHVAVQELQKLVLDHVVVIEAPVVRHALRDDLVRLVLPVDVADEAVVDRLGRGAGGQPATEVPDVGQVRDRADIVPEAGLAKDARTEDPAQPWRAVPGPGGTLREPVGDSATSGRARRVLARARSCCARSGQRTSRSRKAGSAFFNGAMDWLTPKEPTRYEQEIKARDEARKKYAWHEQQAKKYAGTSDEAWHRQRMKELWNKMR